MAREQTREDLVAHLREQYGFLVVSAEMFDAGNEAEAKRIAVVVRTLVHDTPASQSLLELLGYKQKLYFAAQNYVHKPWNHLMFHGLVGLLMPREGPRFAPVFDRLVPRMLAFDDWWQEPVLGTRSHDRLFTRKDLVLALANKDGGAHIDPALDDVYARLARDCDFGMKVSYGSQEFDWKQNPFLPSVRQIGHEMLRTLWSLQMLRQLDPKEPPMPEEGKGDGQPPMSDTGRLPPRESD